MAGRGKTPEEFLAQMSQVNPGVEVLGTYANARTKVACRCRACGFEWEGVPNHLLRGVGCPACAGTQKVDAEGFGRKVADLSPTVELLAPYVNARTRVSCRCRVCGHEWDTLPKSLLQGHACPECGKRRTIERLDRARAEAQAKKDLD